MLNVTEVQKFYIFIFISSCINNYSSFLQDFSISSSIQGIDSLLNDYGLENALSRQMSNEDKGLIFGSPTISASPQLSDSPTYDQVIF